MQIFLPDGKCIKCRMNHWCWLRGYLSWCLYCLSYSFCCVLRFDDLFPVRIQITGQLFLTSLFVFFFFSEYDAQLAPAGASESGMASSSYLEPNHNHSSAGGCGVKSRSGIPGGTGVGTSASAGGLERPPGSMDRVLKIFHYFETNSEPCTWASNIRHGDATDVRVRHTLTHTRTHFLPF